MITVPVLQAAGVQLAAARTFQPILAKLAGLGLELSTKQRVAAFLAQTAHESAGYTVLTEQLSYSTAARVAAVFRSKFDGDRDGKISAAELAEAAKYLRDGPKLANRVYAGRLGNGDALSGDGWRYRGRGLIQVTGRANYTEAARDLREKYVELPDLVAQPLHAVCTAGWFWLRHGCNELADRGDIDGITRVINPAGAGAEDRAARYRKVLGVL